MAYFCKHSARVLRVPKALFSTAAAASATKTPLIPPPFPTFREAKTAILAESDPEKLAELFQQCSHFPTFRRHRPLYQSSIAKLAAAGRFDLIERLLASHSQTSDSKSEGFWVRLMMLYSNSGMVDQALGIFNHISKTKCCTPSEKSLCAFLTVHFKNTLLENVNLRDLLKNASNKIGVGPTVMSHNLILKSFVKRNDVNSARSWIKEMEHDAKVMPNIDSYNILLGAYLKDGNFSDFDGAVKEIAKKGLECNLTAYNSRIVRLCKNKECARAKKLLEEMALNGVKPNLASYDVVIHGFGQLGDFDSAKKVLQSMLNDRHVSPRSRIYYSLVRNMVKEGEFDSALEVCKEIMKRKWVPPFEAMQLLVDGLLKMSRRDEAKDIVEKMRKRLKGNAVDSWGKIEAALPL